MHAPSNLQITFNFHLFQAHLVGLEYEQLLAQVSSADTVFSGHVQGDREFWDQLPPVDPVVPVQLRHGDARRPGEPGIRHGDPRPGDLVPADLRLSRTLPGKQDIDLEGLGPTDLRQSSPASGQHGSAHVEGLGQSDLRQTSPVPSCQDNPSPGDRSK